MKEIIIDENSAQQRIDKYLIKKLNLPKSLINKFIRKKDIKVNQKRTENKYILQIGDKVSLYLKDDYLNNAVSDTYFLSSSSDVDIIYEDENFIFIFKPEGLPTHYSKNFNDNLTDRVKKYLFEKNNNLIENDYFNTLSPLNRLDTNTVGIVIFAKNRPAMLFFEKLQKEKKIKKFYLAEVEGKLQKKSAMLSNYYIKDHKNNRAIILDKDKQGASKISLKYRVIKEYSDSSIVEINLLTGKSHQIRAQFSHIGHALVGDTKYKGKYIKNTHQKLMAYKIEFDFIDHEQFKYLSEKVFTVHLQNNLSSLLS
ncbi:MAG: RluA family pseudouridine synthase [Clostridia bacterium]|nr:RluA family pseudouridine synthase [Clostridia bacterium]